MLCNKAVEKVPTNKSLENWSDRPSINQAYVDTLSNNFYDGQQLFFKINKKVRNKKNCIFIGPAAEYKCKSIPIIEETLKKRRRRKDIKQRNSVSFLFTLNSNCAQSQWLVRSAAKSVIVPHYKFLTFFLSLFFSSFFP